MSIYTPNLNDKRVIKRVIKALQYVSACISDKKSKQCTQAAIERNFGENDLGTWLRRKLLIVTNSKYTVANGSLEGKAKEYIFSRANFDELVEEVRTRQPDALKFFGDKAKKTDASMLKMSEGEVCQNQSTKSPYCTGHLFLTAEQVLALNYALENCGEALASGEFNLRESACGRLHTPIQSIDKHSRGLASFIHGYQFEYDVETCYITLVYQRARQLGLTMPCPTIDGYLANKTERREYLAEQMMSDVDAAKDLLTSIFNGAPFGPNPRWGSFQAVGCKGFLMQRLKENDWLTNLRAEVNAVWKTIEATEPVIHKASKKTGKMRKQVFNSKRKSSVYFKLERQMLDAIMVHLKETDNTFFPIHDGWVCRKKVDENALIQHVFASTGFKIKLSCDELSTVFKEKTMTTPVPKNWKTRPRYASLLKELNAVSQKYPQEAAFAKEALERWVEDIPSFFEQVTPPDMPKMTLEQMEDYLQGKNEDHRGESVYYGEFGSDCLNEYEDEFGEEAVERMLEMFEDPLMNP